MELILDVILIHYSSSDFFMLLTNDKDHIVVLPKSEAMLNNTHCFRLRNQLALPPFLDDDDSDIKIIKP